MMTTLIVRVYCCSNFAKSVNALKVAFNLSSFAIVFFILADGLIVLTEMLQKSIHYIIFLFFLLGTTLLFGQSTPVGVWKTIDDETGEAKSHVEIYEENGLLYGKVVKLLQHSEDTLCEMCPDDKKNQPLMDMVILWDLSAYKEYWSYGEILDPENGKIYSCSIWLQDDNTLKVRGYVGVSFLGRNQFWYRVK
jgi:uncharacterized protein (DUF2147 family)